jgi:hypothetical protein
MVSEGLVLNWYWLYHYFKRLKMCVGDTCAVQCSVSVWTCGVSCSYVHVHVVSVSVSVAM